MDQPSAFLFVIEVALCRCVGLESLSASNLSVFPNCAESLRRIHRGDITSRQPKPAIAQLDFARHTSALIVCGYYALAQMSFGYWPQDVLLESVSASADFGD